MLYKNFDKALLRLPKHHLKAIKGHKAIQNIFANAQKPHATSLWPIGSTQPFLARF